MLMPASTEERLAFVTAIQAAEPAVKPPRLTQPGRPAAQRRWWRRLPFLYRQWKLVQREARQE